MEPIDTETGEHYTWGDGCDGWHLVDGEGLSVISERVPPGEAEQRHVHGQSRQFFYVLDGEAVVEVDGEEYRLVEHRGIEVPPGTPHQFRNESGEDVEFLVVSAPATRGDRVEVPRE